MAMPIRGVFLQLQAPAPAPPRFRDYKGTVMLVDGRPMMRTTDQTEEPPPAPEPKAPAPVLPALPSSLTFVRDVIAAVRIEMMRLDPPIEVTEFGFFHPNHFAYNVMARHAAISVVKHFTNASLPEIGRRIRAACPSRLGLKLRPMDHTTVLNALRRAAQKYDAEPRFKQVVDNVMARFEPASAVEA